jgi:hypothetical protein
MRTVGDLYTEHGVVYPRQGAHAAFADITFVDAKR